MYWINKSIHLLGRMRRRSVILLAVLGPGIITMVADNDAGGITTYSQTGSKTGFSLLWICIILVPMVFYIQEMTVRLGAVTKRGLAEAIFDAFGPVWGWFSIADLAVINWLTLVTEYIGMTQAMRMFGIPEWITFLGVTALMFAIVVSGKYWTFEKITLVFCLFNMIYIPAAFWAMQTGNVPGGWGDVAKGFYSPSLFSSESFGAGAMLMLILANIGTTVTPWQIFFQQSAVVDKGMDIRDVKFGMADTLFGALLTCGVAAFIIIATAGVFYFNPHGQIVIQSAAEAADKMPAVMPHTWGYWARGLFAIGLFDAGFLGALCISLSTSWAVGEVFGWAHSLNKSVKDAPWFYVVYLAMLGSAGAVSLVSSIELQNGITIFVQVVAMTLLPAALVFLILLLNDKPLMGQYVNTRWQNIANCAIVLFVITMSSLFGISVVFNW